MTERISRLTQHKHASTAEFRSQFIPHLSSKLPAASPRCGFFEARYQILNQVVVDSSRSFRSNFGPIPDLVKLLSRNMTSFTFADAPCRRRIAVEIYSTFRLTAREMGFSSVSLVCLRSLGYLAVALISAAHTSTVPTMVQGSLPLASPVRYNLKKKIQTAITHVRIHESFKKLEIKNFTASPLSSPTHTSACHGRCPDYGCVAGPANAILPLKVAFTQLNLIMITPRRPYRLQVDQWCMLFLQQSCICLISVFT